MRLGARKFVRLRRYTVSKLRHVLLLSDLFLGLSIIGFCGLFVSGTACAAQNENPVLRVKVDLQPIDVQVKDTQGNDVPGLSARDFTLLENGRPQKIAFFGVGNDPVTLTVLVDSSSSVDPNNRLGSAEEIAGQFLHTARPGDEISAMDFTDQMGQFRQITREELAAPSGMALSSAPSSGSALYDAIADTLCHLRTSHNLRQAIVVITDGIDQHSRITLEQLIGLVRSSRAQLFMIGLGSRPELDLQGHFEPKLTLVSGHDIDNPVIVFERLMKESDAESFIPNSERNLQEALKAVSDTLQAQYTLAYYPQNASQTLRRIEVKVDRPNVRVIARSFVGSDQEAAEPVHFEAGTCTVSPRFHPYPYELKLTRGRGGLLYREDFSDPKSGWPNHENSRYVADGYQIFNPVPKVRATNPTANINSMIGEAISIDVQQNTVAAYGPWWNDFRASATVNATRLGSNGADAQWPYEANPAAGLVFRLNQNGYYAMLLMVSPGTKQLSVKLVKREFQANSETDIVPWTQAVGQGSDSGTKLSVESVGNQITLFVDDQQVKQIRDDGFDQGYVGFVVSGPARALFRNLTVEQR
jgi:Ca-activated chloride channel homolog